MPYVLIGPVENDELKPIVTVKLKDGVVNFTGDPELIQELKEGIQDERGRILTPDDGSLFLMALSHYFTNPYFLASSVIED